MCLNNLCLFGVVDSVIHCRNSFEAGIRLLELELLVRPGRVNYKHDSMQDNATHGLQLRAPRSHSSAESWAQPCASTCGTAAAAYSCRCFADTYQNMAEAVAKSWTRRRSNVRGHKSLLSHVYDSAEAWCCARCRCRVYIKSTRKLET